MEKTIEKDIVKVTYEFKDGKTLILKGKELDHYKFNCMMQSDYALPANENSKVKTGGLIRGFTPCPMI